MPIATAAALKAAVSPDVMVDVPGTDLQIRCRRPSLETMVASRLVTLPRLRHAVELQAQNQTDTTFEATDDFNDHAQLLDAWCCEAAIEPRLVPTPAAAADGGAVYIGDVPFALKFLIFTATLPKTISAGVVAGAEFRPGAHADGTVDRPGGEAVRDAAVGIA